MKDCVCRAIEISIDSGEEVLDNAPNDVRDHMDEASMNLLLALDSLHPEAPFTFKASRSFKPRQTKRRFVACKPRKSLR